MISIDNLACVITLDGPLGADQRASLKAIAERCPAHRTLLNDKHIDTIVGSTGEGSGPAGPPLEELATECT